MGRGLGSKHLESCLERQHIMAVVGMILERGLLSTSVTTGTHTCLHTHIHKEWRREERGREIKPVTHGL